MEENKDIETIEAGTEEVGESISGDVVPEDESVSARQEVKKKKNGSIAGIIFLIIVSVATFVTLFSFADIGETFQAIGTANGWDLLWAVLCFCAYVAVYPLGLCVLGKINDMKSSFTDNYLIGASEHFFNGITPYQTGAQPFQVYSYVRRGDKAGKATGIIIMNFLALLIASNLFVAFSMIFASDFFAGFVSTNTVWIAVLGIVINLFTLVMFVIVATCKWVRNGLMWIMEVLCKIKFVGKILSKKIPAFGEYCDNAQRACREAFANIGAFTLLVLIKVVSLFFYYSIPYFILRSLGIGGETFIYTLLATAFAVNAVVWIPTPGTSGGIEFSFTTIFGLTSSAAAAAALLWRGLTYYLLLVVSLVEYLIFEVKLKIINKKEKAEEMSVTNENDEKTYYDLPEKIDVLIAGDENVYEGIALTVLSAAMRSSRPIIVHLMTTFAVGTKGITLEKANALRVMLQSVDADNELEYIDATEAYDEFFVGSPNEKPAYSPCSLLRLFAPRYINCERLVYLDADTMCCAGLEEFFTVDISEAEMAVALDYLGKFWIKKDYFNSGVLFINVPKIKETRLFERSVEMLTEKKLFFADQSALYLNCKDKVYVPMRFNEQRDVKADTVVKHFCKGIKWLPIIHPYNIKQWQRDKVRKKLGLDCFDDIYAKYDELMPSEEK